MHICYDREFIHDQSRSSAETFNHVYNPGNERMPHDIAANASPEKRFFISLITRDIPLVAAFLDLVDNSVNAAVEPYSEELQTAEDYLAMLADSPNPIPRVTISVNLAPDKIEVIDTAGGISTKVAADHVFKFGRSSGEAHASDRLSVYGIGLKRAMFKLGNKIVMRSDHVDGGFDLNLDVAKWAKDRQEPWTFSLTPRPPAKASACGTSIAVTQLYEDVRRRLSDGVFDGQLRETVGRTYAYYLAKFVSIKLNGTEIDGVNITLGKNYSSEHFKSGKVTCAVTAGIGVPQAGAYRDRSSGWFVFCNGRAVISADKSPLTTWGGGGLPIFQPKHRPFLGIVFFVSPDPEQLPWTTTKSGINEDSGLWQTAKRHMAAVGHVVVSFLDGRYTDQGTDIASKQLQEDAGGQTVSALSAAVAPTRVFEAPKRPAPSTMRIQFDAKIEDIKAIARYLKRPSMSGSEIGRHTFDYFLRNEVGED